MGLADTFRALGQVMHLVQDASVPAHTRGDSHVYYDVHGKEVGKYHYEVWVNSLKYDDLSNLLCDPSAVPLGFDTSILNITSEPSAPIPIANIFDTNKYDGSNPGVAIGTSIGLTEYTNANFFSEHTIFKDYPHPAFEDTNYWNALNDPVMADAEDGNVDNRIYIRKVVGEPMLAWHQ